MRRSRLRAAVLVGCLASGGLVACPATALASPQDVIGFGYRSIAMGNTGAAAAEGVDAVYHNPALLSASRALALELGLLGSVFQFEADDTEVPLVDYGALSATTIGGLLPLPFGGVLTDRVTIGLGFVTPTDVVVRGRILYPENPQFLLGDRVQTVAIQGGLGVDIGHGVRVGAGVMALAALTGSVTVATDASGRLGTVVEDTLVAAYAPVVGATYEFDAYRIGLTFRGVLQARFNVVIEAENLGQLTIPPLNISGVAQYDPWQLAAEFARVHGDFRFAAGVTYKRWPAYPGPVEATVRCEDQPDPTLPCLAPPPADVAFRPVVSPRAGAEYTVPLGQENTFSARAGYAFESANAPEQTGATNYFDNQRSIFSLGYGITLPTLGLSLDGFLQSQLLHPRPHQKPSAPPIDTRGAIWSAGLAAEVAF
ncbi:MAG: hypothetical protein AAF715_30695 [Myxococcota bacterium]